MFLFFIAYYVFICTTVCLSVSSLLFMDRVVWNKRFDLIWLITCACCMRFSQLLSAPFLVAFETQSLRIIRETDDRWIPLPHVKFLRLFGCSDSATATQHCVDVFISTHTASAAARMPIDCSELHKQPVDAVPRPTFLQKLCYKLPSVLTFTFLQTFD